MQSPFQGEHLSCQFVNFGIAFTKIANTLAAFFFIVFSINSQETDSSSSFQQFVETIFGRRCNIKGINDKNFALRGFAERQSINAPIQGTAADIMKKAMIKVQTELNKTRLDAKMILQVHDEIILEVKEKNCEAVSKLLEKNMSGATRLKVPLEIKLGVGNNWDQVH